MGMRIMIVPLFFQIPRKTIYIQVTLLYNAFTMLSCVFYQVLLEGFGSTTGASFMGCASNTSKKGSENTWESC